MEFINELLGVFLHSCKMVVIGIAVALPFIAAFFVGWFCWIKFIDFAWDRCWVKKHRTEDEHKDDLVIR